MSLVLSSDVEGKVGGVTEAGAIVAGVSKNILMSATQPFSQSPDAELLLHLGGS